MATRRGLLAGLVSVIFAGGAADSAEASAQQFLEGRPLQEEKGALFKKK